MRIVYEQLSGIQLSDSETAPMACQKPNLPPKPNVTYDCCEAMIGKRM